MPVFRIITLCLAVFPSLLVAQDLKTWHQIPADSLTPVEQALCRKIMEYRSQQGLPPVPVSASLNYVARTHALDLAENHPNVGYCNLHSWSESKEWRRCCYTPDHKNAACMWNKPRELTPYRGDGFEIAFYTSARFNDPEEYADFILESWKNSKGHNALISNREIWRKTNWQAIGFGVYKGYATVWFGKEPDGAGFRIEIK